MLVKSLLFSALAATVAASSAVIDLLPSNFDKVVLESGKPTLVEFFAPWCGHCKKLAPVWEELATSYEHAKDKIQIAKVDADAERALGKRFGVQGFPTLKFFDGKSADPVDYKSGRDLDSLTNYLVDKTGVHPKKTQDLPSSVSFLDDSNFDAAIGGDKNVLVAFTAPWCGHCKNLAPIWESVATDYASDDNVLIAKVDADAANGKATAQAHGVTSYPTIKFFPAGSKDGILYQGGRAETDFLSYVNEEAGTHRLPGGNLDNTAGTIAALDAVVAKLTGANLAEITEEVNKVAAELKEGAQHKYAEYYVRVFDKLGKSNTWASNELRRLGNILSKSGLAPAKRDDMTSKTNVLRSFVETLTKATQEVKDEL